MFPDGDMRVVIIGGGATGVLLACHLLRDPDRRVQVTIVEKSDTAGLGLAYSTRNPQHTGAQAMTTGIYRGDFSPYDPTDHRGQSIGGDGLPSIMVKRATVSRHQPFSVIAPRGHGWARAIACAARNTHHRHMYHPFAALNAIKAGE